MLYLIHLLLNILHLLLLNIRQPFPLKLLLKPLLIPKLLLKPQPPLLIILRLLHLHLLPEHLLILHLFPIPVFPLIISFQ